MVKKIKTDVDGLLSVSIMKINLPIDLVTIELLFIFKTKSCQSTSIFIFSAIFQIWKKTNFTYFGHKYVENSNSSNSLIIQVSLVLN